MLWKIVFIDIFIMLQKNAFGQKNFKFHARVQGFMQEKVQKGDFLKKTLTGIEKIFLF